MNAPATNSYTSQPSVVAAIEAACATIAPTWPLDRMIAVNPYWQRIQQPFHQVAQTLAEVAGSPLTMPLSYYSECWQRGDIEPHHLQQAIAETQLTISTAEAIAALTTESAPLTPAPLLSDALDGQRDLLHEPAWNDTITHQIAQFCAAHFDEAQADWRPDQQQELYANWRDVLGKDHSVALLMKAPQIPAKAKTLAATPEAQIQQALEQLGVEPPQWPLYLQAVLMRVGGWAAWCAYLNWQATLAGSEDATLVDLLAIRLSWEVLIDDAKRHQGSVWNRWQTAWREHFQNNDDSTLSILLLWQRADEISYQQALCHTLSDAQPQPVDSPKVQAVFCIDVRSEVFRRHLEAQSSTIHTLGFAGFFGLPLSYTPLGTQATRPQLPGLLAPALDITDTSGNATQDQQLAQQRHHALNRQAGWRPFQSAPASAFTLVETLGLGYLTKLIKRSLPSTAKTTNADHLGLDGAAKQALRPSLTHRLADDLDAQVTLAAQVLTGMNLTSGLADWVLLIGHGSQNQNNPQQAGLDCGACCGQTGEVNARALADLLNDPAVREQLPQHGIKVPATTRFVAGLHNTTTDEVTLFDTSSLATDDQQALEQISQHLAAAGLSARQERAPALGLPHLIDQPKALTKAVKQRANDWAQTRPEWGLANNAAFVIAPRARTRGVDLAGRSFLHEYDHESDTEGALLEQIMTAPMVVTHWINMQYYASTVDNHRYGSGNKTLHNVVGGRLGVFEGNGGDLRIGLAWQSVHDGEQWQHQPLRLNVFIAAPQERIARVIEAHEMLTHLVHNQWLYIFQWGDDGKVANYQQGHWQPVS